MVFIQEIVYLNRKDGAYVINLDGCKSIGTRWIELYVISENMTYFDSYRRIYSKRNQKTHWK